MSWVQLDSGQRVARKRHACEWCPGEIAVGERHAWWVGVEDGDPPVTARVHLECAEPLGDSIDQYADDDLFCPERGSHERGQRHRCDE